MVPVSYTHLKTAACDKHSNGSSAFYALYVAGESGEVECNVYGGEFTSISKVAAFVGNSNDGGDKKEALVHIYGGSFISQSDDKEAVHVDEALGGLEIAGGTFSSDVSEYVVEGTEITEGPDGTFIVGELDAVSYTHLTSGLRQRGGVYAAERIASSGVTPCAAIPLSLRPLQRRGGTELWQADPNADWGCTATTAFLWVAGRTVF